MKPRARRWPTTRALGPFRHPTRGRHQPLPVRPAPRPESREGKTPEITIAHTRHLLTSIDPSAPSGVRDRAILGTVIDTGARSVSRNIVERTPSDGRI